MCDPLLKMTCVGLLAMAASAAQADTPASVWDQARQAWATGSSSHQLEIDNDSLLFRKRDGFYTSGVRYTMQSSLRGSERVDSYGWRLGQEIYTPSDIKLPPSAIAASDHPYAGWLYGGVFRSFDTANGRHLGYGIDVGCLGPCAGGEWVQRNLHRIIDQPQPQGWSTQLGNEAGVVLYADYAPHRWQPAAMLDITPRIHGRFGNILTDAGLGLLLRAGHLNQLPGQATLHGFVRVDARAVGYNASLQGGYFSRNDPRTVAPKRLVGETEVGVAWASGAFSLNASVVRRSTEIADLSNALAAQNFVRLLFSYTPQ